jgi:hypothetical protein
MFQTELVGKIKTHFTINNVFFFFENRSIYENLEKYFRAGQATTAHALCMLITLGYKHTVRICNTYWIVRTRLNVTSH